MPHHACLPSQLDDPRFEHLPPLVLSLLKMEIYPLMEGESHAMMAAWGALNPDKINNEILGALLMLAATDDKKVKGLAHRALACEKAMQVFTNKFGEIEQELQRLATAPPVATPPVADQLRAELRAEMHAEFAALERMCAADEEERREVYKELERVNKENSKENKHLKDGLKKLNNNELWQTYMVTVDNFDARTFFEERIDSAVANQDATIKNQQLAFQACPASPRHAPPRPASHATPHHATPRHATTPRHAPPRLVTLATPVSDLPVRSRRFWSSSRRSKRCWTRRWRQSSSSCGCTASCSPCCRPRARRGPRTRPTRAPSAR